MPRGVRKVKSEGSSPRKVTPLQQKIRDAESKLAAGNREAVFVSDEQLELTAALIEELQLTKAQVLRRAVTLGFAVLENDRPKVDREDRNIPEAISSDSSADAILSTGECLRGPEAKQKYDFLKSMGIDPSAVETLAAVVDTEASELQEAHSDPLF